MKAGCSSSGFSPLDTALLNTSMNTPVVPIPIVKDEKNPFSPEQYPQVEEEMFPPLASNAITPEASAVESLPNKNYLPFGGVYYQPVPPPHNVVVTHSTVPRPDLVPAPIGPMPSVDLPVAASEIPLPATATDTETNASDLSIPLVEAPSASAATNDTVVKLPSNPQAKEDRGFAVPKEPSSSGSTKTRRRARPRSRSSSSRNSEPSQARRPQGVNSSDSLTNAKRVRGVGRGKAKELANVMPTPSPNLLTGAVAPENIRITVPAGGGSRKVEIVLDYPANIAHLAQLEDDTRRQEGVQLSSSIKADFTVQLPREDPQEDSEIDILTGEIKSPKATPMQFSFQALSVLEDHQRFAQEVLKLEPNSWDRTKVESNPSLFYHAYFTDQQKLNEVLQRSTVRIQQFNVKVTR